MTVYLDVVFLLNVFVDFFLLLGTNRLCGHPPGWGRCALGALFGGVYAGVCLLPEFLFLGNMLWRLVSLLFIGALSFGVSIASLRRTVVFLLLNMALGGIAVGIGGDDVWVILSAAICLSALCFVGFRTKLGSVQYVPVELKYGKKHIHLTALRDTGNSLCDPITGKPVLVVCGEVANRLTGLTIDELSRPLETMTNAPIQGLRLIPYRSVGQPAGLLLALKLPYVRIGKWSGSSLVAFAPEQLSGEGDYKALAGGIAS